MSKPDYSKFQNLTFEDFRKFATDDTLSKYEKIGFPDAYRAGKEEAIFQDILQKLTPLSRHKQLILDVGPGCSDLPHMIIRQCETHDHQLLMIDSQEVLDQLPDRPFITKISGHYPDGYDALFNKYSGGVDGILIYSVLHYIFEEGRLFESLDCALKLLKDGGAMLIGDIPNQSKRNRFFQSPNGIRYHQEYTGTSEIPEVSFNTLESGHIDDAILQSIVMRYRQSGFDVYWLPQPDELPMANRREDLLIVKP